MEALESSCCRRPAAGFTCRTGAAAEIHRCLSYGGTIAGCAPQMQLIVSLETPSPPSPNWAFGSGFTAPRGVHRLAPSPVRRGLGRVLVVPVPPLVGRGLRVAFRRVLP